MERFRGLRVFMDGATIAFLVLLLYIFSEIAVFGRYIEFNEPNLIVLGFEISVVIALIIYNIGRLIIRLLKVRPKSKVSTIFLIIGISLAIFSLILQIPNANATQITASEDSRTDSSNPTTNYGSQFYLKQGVFFGTVYRSYLKFYQSFSSSYAIESAYLKVFQYADGSIDLPNIEVWSVTDDSWSQNSITWNNQPALSTKLDNRIVENVEDKWYSFDVTSFVQSQITIGDNTISFALKFHDESDNGTQGSYSAFHSSEAGENKPYLEIHVVPHQPDQLKLDNQASPARAKSLTPTFAFRYTDNDGDNMTAFQIQIGADNSIGESIFDRWDYAENRSAENGGIVSIVYGGVSENGWSITGPISLGRGTWYYWRVRTTDNLNGILSGNWGDWSGYQVGTEYAAESFFTNQLPLCSITASNGTPQKGDSVQFYSNASDPDNDNLTYAWNFGDSSTSDQADPTHAYSSSGSKTVTLIVNDGYENSVQDTTTIIVQEAGGGGGGPSWVPPAINKIVKPYTNLLFRSWFKIGFFSFNLFWLLLLIIILAYLYEKKPKGIMWSAILILGFLVVFGAGLGIL